MLLYVVPKNPTDTLVSVPPALVPLYCISILENRNFVFADPLAVQVNFSDHQERITTPQFEYEGISSASTVLLLIARLPLIDQLVGQAKQK